MTDRMIRYFFTAAAALSMLAVRGAVSAPNDRGAASGLGGRGSASARQDAGLPAAGLWPGPVLRDSLPQGIEGTVYRVGGNHMPDPHHPAGAPAGVRSTVYIFELTNIGQVIRQGSSPYYTSIGTRFVEQAETDERGHFRVGLPPGTYSLFTKKGNLFYASQMDDKNNIAPVKVLPGKMTPVECRVESDHKAVY